MEIPHPTVDRTNEVMKEYNELLEAPSRSDNSTFSILEDVLEAATPNPEEVAARHEFLENTFIKNAEVFNKISALRRGKRSVASYLLKYGITKGEAKLVKRLHLRARKKNQPQD